MPFTEDLAVNTPISSYAASKKAAELMAYSHHYLYGIDVSICRYFTVYGPAGRPDMCIFRFIKWIVSGIPIELFGDGSQSRDFTFVDDIARGTIAATKSVGYEVFNLGGGNQPMRQLSTRLRPDVLCTQHTVRAQRPELQRALLAAAPPRRLPPTHPPVLQGAPILPPSGGGRVAMHSAQ